MISFYDGLKTSLYGVSTTLVFAPFKEFTDTSFNKKDFKFNVFVLNDDYQETRDRKVFFANYGYYFEGFLYYYNFKKNYNYSTEYMFRIKNPNKYWYIINKIFAYRSLNNVDDSNFFSYGNTFLRIENNFLISSDCEYSKSENQETVFNFEDYPYSIIPLKFKKLLDLTKAGKRDLFKPDTDEGYGNDAREEHYYTLEEILELSVFIDGSKVKEFHKIPQTRECDLVKQLYELYSDMLKEFEYYDHRAQISLEEYIQKFVEKRILESGRPDINEEAVIENWKTGGKSIGVIENLKGSDCIRERALIKDFLQSMKDFFYVSKNL
jgi:hypothetical protein